MKNNLNNDKKLSPDKIDSMIEQCKHYGFLPDVSKRKISQAIIDKLDNITNKALTHNIPDQSFSKESFDNYVYLQWTKSFNFSNTKNSEPSEDKNLEDTVSPKMSI